MPLAAAIPTATVCKKNTANRQRRPAVRGSATRASAAAAISRAQHGEEVATCATDRWALKEMRESCPPVAQRVVLHEAPSGRATAVRF